MTDSPTFPDFRTSLAQLSDADLADVLRARPDATFPLPPGFNPLASRLTLPGSLARAVRRLTALEIAALETAGDLGAEWEPVSVQEIVEKLPVPADNAVARLRQAALLYGPDPVKLTPGALSALPQGWRVLDHAPDNAAELIDALDAPARAVLTTLAQSGSVGTTRDAAADADPTRPVPRLIAQGLLVRVNANTVRLSRPVRDIVRGGGAREFPLAPITPTTPALDDDSATSQGLAATRAMRRLIVRLGQTPVALNKDGSVGVRALSTLAKDVELTEEQVSLVVTVGEAAGLVGRGVVDSVDATCLAPTKDALAWSDARQAEQWAILLAGWCASPWRLDLAGTKDEKGQAIRLLGKAMHSPDVRHARKLVLEQFTRFPGMALELETVLHNLRHFAPLAASGLRDELVAAIIDEAHQVGALAANTASTPLVALGSGDDLVAATTHLVPPEVTYVIPQADMTILAPGPLPPEMQSELELFATVEASGVASVFRVSESSISTALNAGREPHEIRDWLERHAPTGVPQPMAFLIDDVARSHGRVRAGEALSYIRSDDEALITHAVGLLGDTLTRIAPQAAIARVPLRTLMSLLREAGLQPTAEDATGAHVSMAPEPQLVAATPSTLPKEPSLHDDHLAKALTTLRGDEETPIASAAETTPDHVATLQAAARAGKPVRIGYVNKNGAGKQVTVVPLSVSAGQVDAQNEKTGAVVRISLPRITQVTAL